MAKLTPNFSRHEFACRCGCGRAGVDFVTLVMLEKIRKAAGNETITVTSAFRCEAHNRDSGGVEDSFHLTGRAADIRHRTLEPLQIYKLCCRMFPKSFGFGLYIRDRFVHIDSGPKRRWKGPVE